MEQELSKLAKENIVVSFSPHLVPMNRGMISTMYASLKRPLDQAGARSIFVEYWKGKPWIRVLPDGLFPETRNARGSMYCDLTVIVDGRAGKLIIVSAIDNLCRGASGQAVANANIMLGLPVDAGLKATPFMP
jgi:N-acetyl-gamma-glutamyl-phosphate reductase